MGGSSRRQAPDTVSSVSVRGSSVEFGSCGRVWRGTQLRTSAQACLTGLSRRLCFECGWQNPGLLSDIRKAINIGSHCHGVKSCMFERAPRRLRHWSRPRFSRPAPPERGSGGMFRGSALDRLPRTLSEQRVMVWRSPRALSLSPAAADTGTLGSRASAAARSWQPPPRAGGGAAPSPVVACFGHTARERRHTQSHNTHTQGDGTASRNSAARRI